ncbi:TetR/AcrR family transcriptional regulator [Paenibacillaceae bacterium WGS1546]|uniref:TetR/AcrR family transcriptional regulator n=1 Tax=Cohnella sp. WGS1546 TaxID=3366810 RepID=UPI00372D7CFC
MANNKREEILKAALSLFAERKYDGTTVPMIADKAQVGAGTIYRYFESKEVLVNELFQACVTNLSDRLSSNLLNPDYDLRRQFHLIFHRLVEFADERSDALMFLDSHHNAHYLNERSQRVFMEMLDLFRMLLENGKKQGIIQELKSEAMIAIVWGAFVHVYKIIRSGMLERTEELLLGVEESCWNAIKRH